jgi:thiamine-phosphate pyrophosphorylase
MMATPDMKQQLRLMVVSDGRGDALRVERVMLAAALGGATSIVLREPNIPPQDKIALTRRLIEVLRPHGVLVFLNDRIDVALAAGADGAQLGFRSLPLDVARRSVPPDFLLGFSAHEGDPLNRIAEGGANFVFLGPIFDTPSKRGWKEPLGVQRLQALASTCKIPVVAIGGIELTNVAMLRGAPIAGAAVVRSVFEAADPKSAARDLRAQLG